MPFSLLSKDGLAIVDDEVDVVEVNVVEGVDPVADSEDEVGKVEEVHEEDKSGCAVALIAGVAGADVVLGVAV